MLRPHQECMDGNPARECVPQAHPQAPPPANQQACRIPVGIQAIHDTCGALYPSIRNPLQVVAKRKIWLGGTSPLDFISMYPHPSAPCTPQHWHYVSMGLSDLYGDGRVAFPPQIMGSNTVQSGMGIELTFRLKRGHEDKPPTWPAVLLQAVAKQVMAQGRGSFCAGDTIRWGAPLPGHNSGENCAIRHMMLDNEPQLVPMQTPFGNVTFIQVVGVMEEELSSAERWNGPGMLKLLKSRPDTGGPLLVTDPYRIQSLFEIYPHLRTTVDQGIENEGSNLAGITGYCRWDIQSNTLDTSAQLMNSDPCVTPQRNGGIGPSESNIAAIEISMNRHTVSYMPLMFAGRLRHNLPFNFMHSCQSMTLEEMNMGVTFTGDTTIGNQCGIVENLCPNRFSVKDNWMYVTVPAAWQPIICNEIVQALSYHVPDPNSDIFKIFEWNQFGLKLIVKK